MLRHMYVLPGAGGNFIALHCLWRNQINLGGINTEINRFDVPRQYSTLWDFNNKKSSYHELVFASMYPELKKHYDVWNTMVEFPNGNNRRFALSQFFRLLHQNRVSPGAYEVLTKDYFWLPIFDYSIYYGISAGRSEELDYYCKYLMDMCWETHKSQGKDLISIIHYHPEQCFEEYNYPSGVETLGVSINDCEEFITDLMAIKSNVQDENSLNHPPEGIRHAIDNCTVNEERSDINLEYKKIFFDNDIDEMRELYKFCGNEDFFDTNKKDILGWFKTYNRDNQKIVNEFDWKNSNIDRMGK